METYYLTRDSCDDIFVGKTIEEAVEKANFVSNDFRGLRVAEVNVAAALYGSTTLQLWDDAEPVDVWDVDVEVEKFGVEVPAWVEDDITVSTLTGIVQGGCASGAYMPAVTQNIANDVMHQYGDDVLDYIKENGEMPDASEESWSWMASAYLAYAVELWASATLSELGFEV